MCWLVAMASLSLPLPHTLVGLWSPLFPPALFFIGKFGVLEAEIFAVSSQGYGSCHCHHEFPKNSIFLHSSGSFIHSLVRCMQGLGGSFAFKHTHKTRTVKWYLVAIQHTRVELSQTSGLPAQRRQQVAWSVTGSGQPGMRCFLTQGLLSSREPGSPSSSVRVSGK